MATWAGKTIIYVDDFTPGSNTSPYDTWAKAATGIQSALTLADGGDNVIFVADDHSEQAATFTFTGGTAAEPIDVYRVDRDDSDAYAPVDQGTPGTANLESTGGDIIFSTFARWHGFYFESFDDTLFTTTDKEFMFYDCYFEANTAGAKIGGVANDTRWIATNCTFHFSHGSGGYFDLGGGWMDFYGGIIKGVQTSGLALFHDPASGVRLRLFGVDLSGLTMNDSLIQTSSNRIMHALFFQCNMPASYDRLDSSISNDTVMIDIVGSDTGGATYIREHETYRGVVTADTSMTRTGGFTDKDGDTALSHRYEPSSVCTRVGRLNGIPLTAWIDSTGSKTFTLEMRHSFTAAPNDDEVGFELYYMGTSAETEFLVDHTVRPKPSAAPSTLTASSETWSTNTNKIYASVTVTVNNIGLYMLVPFCGKYVSGEYLWVCPQVDIT